MVASEQINHQIILLKIDCAHLKASEITTYKLKEPHTRNLTSKFQPSTFSKRDKTGLSFLTHCL